MLAITIEYFATKKIEFTKTTIEWIIYEIGRHLQGQIKTCFRITVRSNPDFYT